MTINIIAYPPGGGGNHLRNLCDLDGRFQEQWPWDWVKQQRVGLRPYDIPPGPPGEVHSLPGRNIHEVFVEQITANHVGDYLLHGHFGELACHAEEIRSWPGVRWLLVTMNDPKDRGLLRQRQQRLQYHPYWLDEEQIYLYRPEMYTHYFSAVPQNICELPLRDLWQKDITSNGVLVTLERAFDLVIDSEICQMLHSKWFNLNFGCQQGQA